MKRSIDKKGLKGISPLIFLIVFYLVAASVGGGFEKVSVYVAFFLASVYAIGITSGMNLADRIHEFGKGAGSSNIMFIIWIFLSAGIFTGSAEAMGCIKETVDAILTIVPSRYLYLSIFVAGCVISMATGSGIGSIIAVGPIAISAARATGMDLPVMCSSVVCGAMFGDNMSFISDTTIIATATQGCELKDKFKANLWLAAPASVITIVAYLLLGQGASEIVIEETVTWWKIVPYLIVLILSICGMNVLFLLLIGTATCLVMGIMAGEFDFFGWMEAASSGMGDMGALALLVLMAAGLLSLIKYNGGVEYITGLCESFVVGPKSAELCICLLSAILCLCTANNTIAIISASDIVRGISRKYGVEPRRAASLMDTSTCVALELTPYGAHLLTIAALAGISTSEMLPHMYYAMALGGTLIVSIIVHKSKTYLEREPLTTLPRK